MKRVRIKKLEWRLHTTELVCNVYAHRKDLNIRVLTFMKNSSKEILYLDMFILVGWTDSMHSTLQPHICLPVDFYNQMFKNRNMRIFAWSSSIVISCSMLLFQVFHGLLLLGTVQDNAYPEKEDNIFKLTGGSRNISSHSYRLLVSHSSSDLTNTQPNKKKRNQILLSPKR